MIKGILALLSSTGFWGAITGALATAFATMKLEKKRLEIQQASLLTDNITGYLSCLKQIDNFLDDFAKNYEGDEKYKQKLIDKISKKNEETQTYQYRIDVVVYSDEKKNTTIHPLFKIHTKMTNATNREIKKFEEARKSGGVFTYESFNNIINKYLLETNQFFYSITTSLDLNKKVKGWILSKYNKIRNYTF